MTRSFCWNSLWCLLIFTNIVAQDPVANIPQGRVVGVKVYAGASSTPVEIYYGIPYATSPKGRYRFSAPERHTGWQRTFYAHRIPPHCPHIGDTDKDHFSEDCLHLNIWTPRHPDGKALPVIVILYSESWIKGGVSLPCQELAAEGVVVVTVLYRLHILAFFTLRSKVARGNLSLLDQYLALLWVRENIPAFGGDPASITVLGHSAGADSLLHLITSPRTVGLFQRAIIISPLDVWKAIDEKRAIEGAEVERISREIAESLGCNTDTDQEILQCMRARPLSDILSLYSNNNWTKGMQPIPDTFLSEPEQFLPKSLFTALSKQTNLQLDLLVGFNDLESLNGAKIEEMMKKGASFITEYTNSRGIPDCLRLFSPHQPEVLPLLINAVRWEYLNTKSKTTDVLDALEVLGRIETSSRFDAGIALLATRLARSTRRIYVYRYSQPAGVDLRGRKHNFTGAVYGSDLVALLGDYFLMQLTRRQPTLEEKRISSILRNYIVNFAKYGSPGDDGSWRQYIAVDGHIHDIDDARVSQYRKSDREVKYWLDYLPRLSTLLQCKGTTEHLTNEEGASRLRGGVAAMCGVALVLLLLLTLCAILLHRLRSRHFTVVTDVHQ